MRDAFHRLRDEELAHVPPFRVARAAPNWRPLLVALAIVVITIVAIVHYRRPPVTESIVTWKAPTDFLLRTPGSELLSTVPQIPERR